MKITNTNFKHLYQALIDRILKGEGYSTQQDRQAAFANENVQPPLDLLVDKVAHQAFKISDKDIDMARQSGVSEDQLFELIICAAVGQASRQYESGLTALADATKKEGGPYAS